MLNSHDAGAGTADVPILLRVAFATKQHADQALHMIARCDDLFASATLHRCATSHDDMGLIDIFVPGRNRDRIEALATGLHGIVVPDRGPSSLTDRGHRPRLA